jgi:hypothetical protein
VGQGLIDQGDNTIVALLRALGDFGSIGTEPHGSKERNLKPSTCAHLATFFLALWSEGVVQATV